ADRLRALDADIVRVTAERQQRQDEATRRNDELRALADRVRPQLANDAAFSAKLASAQELAAIAAESVRKTEQAEKDREERGKPYRDDPLFMYLWERGYGTKAYRANNLVAFLDGHVARLVGYPEAR